MKLFSKKESETAKAELLKLVYELKFPPDEGPPCDLRGWIRKANLTSTHFEMPEEEVVVSYLLGRLSDSQREVVWEAMLASDSFRDQIRDISKELVEEFEVGPDSTSDDPKRSLVPSTTNGANNGIVHSIKTFIMRSSKKKPRKLEPEHTD